jgi:hypothetical protein
VSRFHVDQIATHVSDRYSSDHERSNLDEVNNLSRYLALHSVDLSLGDGPGMPQRIVEVTDGGQDRGIDAIGVDPVGRRLVLVQSKWRQGGTGALDVSETLRFIEGVRSLVGMRNDVEPVHASEAMRNAIRDLLRTPSSRIQIVTASTGSKALAPEVMQPIDGFLAEMNDLEGVDPIATHRHLGQADLFNSLSEKTRNVVNLEVDLLDWGGSAEPPRLFYGRVSGADIARWHQDFGTDLFAENIRVVIPKSEINSGIMETIKNAPERFGYYNNGIVILAHSIATAAGGVLNREVSRIGLSGASIVNGAQTVSTIASAMGTEWEANLSRVFVVTRCIEVPDDDPSLARGITRYANTQNEVSSQDFAFLDDEQHRLARELATLGYEYVIRQSEQPEAEDPQKVIYVRDAAVALACAVDEVALAVTAKREVSRLFAQNGPEYKRLFNPSTDPLLLMRAVMIVRRVDGVLDDIAGSSSGVEFGVAVHGRLVIAHHVINSLGVENLKDPAFGVDEALTGLAAAVEDQVAALSAAFPVNSYPGNVFKNRTRTEELLVDSGLVA